MSVGSKLCSRPAQQTSGAALLLVHCLKRVATAEARAINFVATSQAASPPLRAPRAEPCMAHLFKTNFVEFQGLLE